MSDLNSIILSGTITARKENLFTLEVKIGDEITQITVRDDTGTGYTGDRVRLTGRLRPSQGTIVIADFVKVGP